MINIDLFSDYRIPIIVAAIGLIIISSDFINFSSKRKVTLRQRTKSNKGLIIRVINGSLVKKLNKSEIYLKFIDKIQFNLGYFSADSESKNRINAEKFAIRWILFNILIIIGMLFVNTMMLGKVLMIVGINLIQYLYFNNKINKKKQVLQDQFHILVREFIEGYALTSNIKLSFEYTVDKISPVYQIHINRLIVQLNSSSTIDEAFQYFSNRINYSACNGFVSIVQSAYSTNKNIVKKLMDFQKAINHERTTYQNKIAKLSVFSKNVMLWIVGCIIEIFAMGGYMKTSTGNFYLTTSIGQTLLLFTVGSIIIGLILMSISDNI